MSDHRREIRVDKRLTAREMHEPDAVAFQDVAGELCLGEGSGGRDDTGSLSRAKLQKPQRALQALVMAKWQIPGPPSRRALNAIFQMAGGFAMLLAIVFSQLARFLA